LGERPSVAGTAVFVLVHGPWSGAHGFHLVRRRLWAAGHEAYTPSLTGVGERVHLTGPGVGLGTHVADVVNQILYVDLDDVVLVGFSYGGAVVTAALPHLADRVAHLVYVDAFVPADGESVRVLVGGPPLGPITLGQPWLVPPVPRAYDDPDEAAFADARRVDHPARCFVEPVAVPRPLEDHPFSRTYIRAIADVADAPGAAAFDAAADHARTSSAWRYHGIATNHMIAQNRPDELVTILLDLVDHPAGSAPPPNTVSGEATSEHRVR
jgi:pimeloyl-ACP methyl ester carboxylesterase